MKKKMLIGTLGAALVFGGAFAVGAAGNNDTSTNQISTEKAMLSADEVKAIAMQEVAGVVEEIELKRKSGKFVYEVEIEKDNIDYDLYIDAYSGEIYAIDQDDDNSSNRRQNNKNIISHADAIAIAEKTVNGKVVEIEKDKDDGFIKYEVELITDRGEADVEIDAATGKVLDVEWDD